MIIAVVDEKQDEDPGKYQRLVQERDQAEATLRRELAPQAKRAGIPLDRFVELVKLRELAPAEFQKMHREACRIADESESRLLKLKQVAKELRAAINSEAKSANPFELHRARMDLDKLNALIKRLEKQ